MLQKLKDLKLEKTIFSFSYLILTGNKYFETLFLKITIIENASFIQFSTPKYQLTDLDLTYLFIHANLNSDNDGLYNHYQLIFSHFFSSIAVPYSFPTKLTKIRTQ